MLDKLYIRTAAPNDATILAPLAVTTFVDAFGADNKKEDMDKYIREEMSEDKLQAELADSNNIFYLACIDENIVGFAKVRTLKIPPALVGKRPLEIERLYVLQPYQSHKVGAALMAKCIEYGTANGFDTIWLGVWEHNHKAVNFYKRWGFEFFGSHVFRLGDDDQTDMLMKKEIWRI